MTARTFTGDALLFDMDGVLVDSTAHVERVWREWARRRGVDGDAVMAVAHGRRSLEVLKLVAPHLATDEEVSDLERAEAGGSGPIAVQPGAHDLLTSLPVARWAVVTSATADLAATRLRAVGLPEPTVLVAGDLVADGKPHPAPYLSAAASLGIPPERCIVFEDAPSGIESGRAAGMTVIALATTFGPEALAGADAVVPDLSAVEARAVGDAIEVGAETL